MQMSQPQRQDRQQPQLHINRGEKFVDRDSRSNMSRFAQQPQQQQQRHSTVSHPGALSQHDHHRQHHRRQNTEDSDVPIPSMSTSLIMADNSGGSGQRGEAEEGYNSQQPPTIWQQPINVNRFANHLMNTMSGSGGVTAIGGQDTSGAVDIQNMHQSQPNNDMNQHFHAQPIMMLPPINMGSGGGNNMQLSQHQMQYMQHSLQGMPYGAMMQFPGGMGQLTNAQAHTLNAISKGSQSSRMAAAVSTVASSVAQPQSVVDCWQAGLVVR